MEPVIETENLCKQYGRLAALRNVGLRVDPGEICGFLGPNGAGKSTFVKILLDLIRPSGGSARLFGTDCRSPAARTRVGFLPENIKVYTFLRVDEFVGYHARLAGCRGSRSVRSEVARTLEMVGMAEYSRKRIDRLSKGMLQRVGIAQAMVGRVRLLILDEPTSGLDPIGITELRRLMMELKGQGMTIFFNSHLLSEVERTCDRVAILNRGSVVRTGTSAELSERQPQLELEIERCNDRIAQAIAELCEKPLERRGEVYIATPGTDPDAALRIHQAIVQHGGELRSFTWKRESLEELFYRLIKHADTDNS